MEIDKQLLADCHLIGEWQGIAVLLHKNSLMPWFILVPLSETQVFRELYELPKTQRQQLQLFSDQISFYLEKKFNSKKINIAALGNVVEQLHQHIIGRKPEDLCWPNPVWGNLDRSEQYASFLVEEVRADITRLLESE